MAKQAPPSPLPITSKSINEQMLERTIRHQLFLQRFATHEQVKLNAIIDDAQHDLMGQFARRMMKIEERGRDLGPVTTRRMHQMIMSMKKISKGLSSDLYATLKPDLIELANDEIGASVKILDDTLPIKYEMVLPSPATLRSLVINQPFDGHPLRQWFIMLDQRTQVGLEGAVRQGVLQGETVGQIAQRIRGTKRRNFMDGVLGGTRHGAEAIARTGVNHISTQARQELFKDNADITQGMQWVATLDTRTCPQCMALDGKVMKHDANRRKVPPAHVNCRCTLAPVMKSWQAMGFSADDSAMTPEERKAWNAKPAEKLTYPQWLKGQPKGEQDEALGPNRARLWREGKEKISGFTTRDGRTLTLKELQQREDRRDAA